MRKFFAVFGKIVLLIVIAFGVMMLGSLAAYAVIWAKHGVSSGIDPSETVLDYIQFISVIAAVLIMWFSFKDHKLWPLGLGVNKRKFVRQLSAGMLAGIVTMAVSFVLIVLFGGVTVEGVVFNRHMWTDVALAVILFSFVAINEELLTRGYILGLVKNKYGKISGIMVSSLVFALLHGFNPGMWESPVPIINLLLVALILGWIRERSGSLLVGMGFHFTWNLFQGNIFGFKVSGMEFQSFLKLSTKGNSLINGGIFGAEGSILTTLVLAGFFMFAMKRNKKWMI